MALTANREVDRFVDQDIRRFSVGGAEKIFKGSFVSVDASGYAAPLAAGEQCIGIAEEQADNTTGADADKKIDVRTMGDFELPLTGVAVTDIGAAVYASDDATLTLTATANSFVGWVLGVPKPNTIVLRLDPYNATP